MSRVSCFLTHRHNSTHKQRMVQPNAVLVYLSKWMNEWMNDVQYLVWLTGCNGSEGVASDFARSCFRQTRHYDNVFKAGDRANCLPNSRNHFLDDLLRQLLHACQKCYRTTYLASTKSSISTRETRTSVGLLSQNKLCYNDALSITKFNVQTQHTDLRFLATCYQT